MPCALRPCATAGPQGCADRCRRKRIRGDEVAGTEGVAASVVAPGVLHCLVSRWCMLLQGTPPGRPLPEPGIETCPTVRCWSHFARGCVCASAPSPSGHPSGKTSAAQGSSRGAATLSSSAVLCCQPDCLCLLSCKNVRERAQTEGLSRVLASSGLRQ